MVDLNGARTWTVDDSAGVDADLTVSTVITNSDGGAGTFTKAGVGRLVLSASNTFANAFSVTNGVLRIQNAGALGTTAGATTVTSGEAIELDGVGVAGERLNINGAGFGGSTGALRNLSGTNAWTGDINLDGDARINADAGTQLTVSAIIAGGTSRDITFGGDGDHIASGRIGSGGINPVDQVLKDGTGTLTLENTGNDFTGTVTINNGTLKLGTSEVITNTEAVTINRGTLQLNGFAETITSLTLGAGTTTASGAAPSVIDTPATGILRLGGNVTYNAGSAGFENGQALISANLDLNDAGRTFTVNDSPAVAEDLVITGGISNSGTSDGITKEGEGTLLLSGTGTYDNTTTIRRGVLKLGANEVLPNGFTVALDQRIGGTSVLDLAGRMETISALTLSSGSSTTAGSQNQVIDSVGGGQLVLGGNVTYNAGAAGFHNGSALISASIDLGAANRTFTVNDSDQTVREVVVSGIITGSVNLTKSGTGTLIFQGNNNYSGTTTVSAGTLHVGEAGMGSTGTGAVTVNSVSTILGTGVVKGASFTAASGATIHAGDSTVAGTTGTLSFTPVAGSGSWNFQSGSQIVLDITPGSNTSDQLSFTGSGGHTLAFSGSLTVGPAAFVPVAPQVYQIFSWTGIAGAPTFASHYFAPGFLLGNGDESAGLDLPDISGSGFGWDLGNLTVNGSLGLIMVPEPSRVLLITAGICGMFLRRRRRRV